MPLKHFMNVKMDVEQIKALIRENNGKIAIQQQQNNKNYGSKVN